MSRKSAVTPPINSLRIYLRKTTPEDQGPHVTALHGSGGPSRSIDFCHFCHADFPRFCPRLFSRIPTISDIFTARQPFVALAGTSFIAFHFHSVAPVFKPLRLQSAGYYSSTHQRILRLPCPPYFISHSNMVHKNYCVVLQVGVDFECHLHGAGMVSARC